MVKLKDIREGSIVMVRGGFGRDRAVQARVEIVEDDIKNGLPGIEYTIISNGDDHWAYIDQVERVVTY